MIKCTLQTIPFLPKCIPADLTLPWSVIASHISIYPSRFVKFQSFLPAKSLRLDCFLRSFANDLCQLLDVKYLQGIAKRLVGAALQEAAKKREMRYKDIKKIEKGVRRHFHDDITVVVIYLDHQNSSTSGRFKRSAAGYTTAPVDIFSNPD